MPFRRTVGLMLTARQIRHSSVQAGSETFMLSALCHQVLSGAVYEIQQLRDYRLPAADFKPRKDQKSAVHRWNRFVLGDEYIKEAAKRYPISKE